MRSNHTLSHEHKLSTEMGYLVPISTMEVLPGDTFLASTSLLARIAPLANPVMHSVDIRVHSWFVPNRLLWSEWENWIVGNSESDMPTVTIDSTANHALADNFGIPYLLNLEVNALPFRAYNLIYNEFYRDQDLQTARGTDDLTLARICWEKDYFTTARAAPQQGDAVEIGFSAGSAPLRAPGNPPGVLTYTDGNDVERGLTVNSLGGFAVADTPTSGDHFYADLANMTGGISIDDLRRSIALQRFAEARMKFGSRYADYLRFLGVNPRDGRLDRPEYLGGGNQNVSFSEVLAMAEGASSEVGDMFGHGIAGLRTRRWRKMFEEHGWVLTLLSVRPKTVYEYALPRKFTRADPMDYWQRELEVMPWQEVNQREVDIAGDAATVFGYVPRFDEYRHELSYVSGSFRGGTEEDWHMARTFASPPTLNSSFVECTPTDRVYSDESMPEVLLNVRNSIQARRLVRATAQIGKI